MKFKGQISVEVIVGIVVLLMFLIIVMYYNNTVNDTTTLVKETYAQKNTCINLMRTISSVYSAGNGTTANIEIDFNANIIKEQQIVQVEDEYCYFLAIANNATLEKGTIKITNSNGVIDFEQV